MCRNFWGLWRQRGCLNLRLRLNLRLCLCLLKNTNRQQDTQSASGNPRTQCSGHNYLFKQWLETEFESKNHSRTKLLARQGERFVHAANNIKRAARSRSMYKVVALTREAFKQASVTSLGHQMPNNQAFQKWQLSMKEMPTPRHNHHRQTLWTRPIHYRGQRYRVVLLTMHNQGFLMQRLRHIRHRQPLGSSAYKNNFVDSSPLPERLNGMACNKRTKRKPCNRQSTRGRCLPNNRQKVSLACCARHDRRRGQQLAFKHRH